MYFSLWSKIVTLELVLSIHLAEKTAYLPPQFGFQLHQTLQPPVGLTAVTVEKELVIQTNQRYKQLLGSEKSSWFFFCFLHWLQ